jgi:hypothetical protein
MMVGRGNPGPTEQLSLGWVSSNNPPRGEENRDSKRMANEGTHRWCVVGIRAGDRCGTMF